MAWNVQCVALIHSQGGNCLPDRALKRVNFPEEECFIEFTSISTELRENLCFVWVQIYKAREKKEALFGAEKSRIALYTVQ